jgi:hypothetical protein
MCKELPVIPVNKVVDPRRIIRKKWKAKEEERHKGSLTPPQKKKKLKVSFRCKLTLNTLNRVARFFLAQHTKTGKNIPKWHVHACLCR